MTVYSLAAPLLKHPMGVEDRISDAYLKCAYVLYYFSIISEYLLGQDITQDAASP